MASTTVLETRRVNPKLVFAIVSSGIVLATVDQFIVNVAFGAIAHGLHGSVSSVSWVLNAYSIVFAALLVPAGRLADRSGRRSGFLLGVVVFTLASSACAVAGNVPELVAARVVQAAGAALMVPSSLGLLLAAYPPERRAGAIRAWSAVIAASAALGPVLGGLLVAASWRWIFLVNVPVGIAALVAGRRFLPRVRAEHGPLPDLLGAAVLAGGIGLLALALVQGHSWGWGSAGVLGSLAASGLAAILFVRRSRTHPSPVVELSLLRLRTFSVSTAAVTVYSASFAAMLFSILLWAQTGWHWSALRTGLAFAPGPLMVPLMAALGGRLIGSFGAGRTAAAGCLVFAAGASIWIAQIGTTPNYAGAMLPGALLAGIGVGLTLPTLTAVGVTSLPAERFATGSGVLTMARQIGFTFGVAVVVAVLSSRTDLTAFRGAWIVTAALALAAAPVALAVSRRLAPVVVEDVELVEEAA